MSRLAIGHRAALGILGGLPSIVVAALAVPAAAVAAPSSGAAVPASAATPPTTVSAHRAPKPLACATGSAAGMHASCQTVGSASPAAASAPTGSILPADIAAMYQLPDSGAGHVVAVVGVGGYAHAAADLATYRSTYGLPATTLTTLDEHGGHALPPENPDWSIPAALGLDGVSAACPHCGLVLVEADSADISDLAKAENAAAAVPGVVAIANAYGITGDGVPVTDGDGHSPTVGEDPAELRYDAAFDHPGIAITAPTGDNGYAATWPAMNPHVTAVSGTDVTMTTNDDGTTSYNESNFYPSGFGCSSYEPRPAYQGAVDTGCAGRAGADISAAAQEGDSGQYFAVYDTSGAAGWGSFGGTTLSAALVAGMYGDAPTPTAGTYPVQYLYTDLNRSADIVDIDNGGSYGGCPSGLDAYPVCSINTGWDGPTGWGTPRGIGAFTDQPHGQVTGTVTDSAGGAPVAGAKVSLVGPDSSTTTWTATTGADGTFAMTLPAGTYDGTVTAFGYQDGDASVFLHDGQSATDDVSLDAVPSSTVSGTVADGSGQGWPLYARVDVTDSRNRVVESVETDPTTGAYSVRLPDAASYSLTATPVLLSGYQPRTMPVTIGTSDMPGYDIPLYVDATCTAAGYAWGQPDYFATTDFEGWSGTTATAPWSSTSGGTSVWTFDGSSGHADQTTGSGQWAELFNTTGVGSTGAALASGPVSGFASTGVGPTTSVPVLSFDNYYIAPSYNQTAEVDVSTNGGTSWPFSSATSAGVYWWQNGVGNQAGAFQVPGGEQQVVLTQAMGKSNVAVRFLFKSATLNGSWQLDNVRLGTKTCEPQTGGLVQGTVTDKNTGAPLAAAKVSLGDAHTTTGDHADAGRYELFAPSGDQTVTASDDVYATTTAPATVAANGVTTADVALPAGQLSMPSTTVEGTVTAGTSATQQLTLTNTGTAPLTVSLPVEGASTPGTDPADPEWSQAGALPTAVVDAAGARVDDKTYVFGGTLTPTANPMSPTTSAVTARGYVYDPTQDTTADPTADPASTGWSEVPSMPKPLDHPVVQAIHGAIYVTGGWDATGQPSADLFRFRPELGTWSRLSPMPAALANSASAVLDGQLYVIGGCLSMTTSQPWYECATGSQAVFRYDPGTDTWVQVATYPHRVAQEACAGLDAEIVCAGGRDPDSTTEVFDDTFGYNPSTDTWHRLASMPVPTWDGYVSDALGRMQVAEGATVAPASLSGATLNRHVAEYDPSTDSWRALPNAPVGVARGTAAGGTSIIGGSTTSYSGFASTGVYRLSGYDDTEPAGGLIWLSIPQSEVTIPPAGSVQVPVTLDASQITEAGDLTGYASVVTDSPYPTPSIDVTMHVVAPPPPAPVTPTVTVGIVRNSTTLATPSAKVTVKASGVTPTGVVTVVVSGPGSSVKRTATLAAGVSTVKLPRLAAGIHTVTATYVGDSHVTTGMGKATVAVAKAKPTVRFGSVTARSHGAVKVSVKVGATAVSGGKVTLSVTGHGRTVKVSGTVRQGSVTLHLPRLEAGRYTLKAAYAGTAVYAAGSAAPRQVQIR